MATPAPPVAPVPKQRELFKRFMVQKFLGKGAYGSVYRVLRQSDNMPYAVKETDVTKMGSSERADAANEIRLLASVRHPNIIRYYEAFLDGNWLCIIMEFAPAGDLSHYIKKGRERRTPFPEEVVWSFIIQVMRGVDHMHSKRILHRDIKPMNVFIGKGDIIKIGDLGVAKILAMNAAAQTQIGTPHYMAPEIWGGKPYTYSADVWSMGCLLYEMLTYSVPFNAANLGELKAKVKSGRYTPIATNYSPALKSLVSRMLTLDANQRATVKELLATPEVQQRLPHLPGALEAEQVAPVLGTIVVPRQLKQLSEHLPPAAYDAKAGEGKVAEVAGVAAYDAIGARRA